MANVNLKEVSVVKDTSNNIINQIWNTNSELVYCKPMSISNLGNISVLTNTDDIDINVQSNGSNTKYVIHRSKGHVHEFIYFKYTNNEWSVKTANISSTSIGRYCTWFMDFESEYILTLFWGPVNSATYADTLNNSALNFPYAAHYKIDMTVPNPVFTALSTAAASDSATRNTMFAVHDQQGQLITLTIEYNNGTYYASLNRFILASTGWDFNISIPSYTLILNSAYFNTKMSGLFRALLDSLGLGDVGNIYTITSFTPLNFTGWVESGSSAINMFYMINNKFLVCQLNYDEWKVYPQSTLEFFYSNTKCFRNKRLTDFGSWGLMSSYNGITVPLVNQYYAAVNNYTVALACVNMHTDKLQLYSPTNARNFLAEDAPKYMFSKFSELHSRTLYDFYAIDFSDDGNYISTAFAKGYDTINGFVTYDKNYVESGSHSVEIINNHNGTYFYIDYAGDLYYVSPN